MNDYKVGNKFAVFVLEKDGFKNLGNMASFEHRGVFWNITKKNWCPSFFMPDENNLRFLDNHLVIILAQPECAFIYSIDNKRIIAIDGRSNIYEKKLN